MSRTRDVEDEEYYRREKVTAMMYVCMYEGKVE